MAKGLSYRRRGALAQRGGAARTWWVLLGAGAVLVAAGCSSEPASEPSAAPAPVQVRELPDGAVALASASLDDRGAVVAGGFLWVTRGEASDMVRVDLESGELVEEEPIALSQGTRHQAFVADGEVWVTSDDREQRSPGRLQRFDATSGERTGIWRLSPADGWRDLVEGGGAVWVTNPTADAPGLVTRVSLDDDRAVKVPTGGHLPQPLVWWNDALYVAHHHPDTYPGRPSVVRLDASGRPTGRWVLGRPSGCCGLTSLAIAADALWVTDVNTSTLTLISAAGEMSELTLPFDCAGRILVSDDTLYKGSYECMPMSLAGVWRADATSATPEITEARTEGTPMDYEIVGKELWVSRREGGVLRFSLPDLRFAGSFEAGNSFLVPDDTGRVWAGVVAEDEAGVIALTP
jgi:hypothetical protein